MSQAITTQITYLGDQTRKTLAEYPDVRKTIWEYFQDALDTVVRVHVEEPDKGILTWELNVSSPAGRQSFMATQRNPGGLTTIRRIGDPRYV